MVEYDLLREPEEDKKKVEQFVDLLNEIEALERRLSTMQKLAMRNKKLKRFAWRTREGVWLAAHLIPDDHLHNIMQYAGNFVDDLPEGVVDEYEKRNLIEAEIVADNIGGE